MSILPPSILVLSFFSLYFYLLQRISLTDFIVFFLYYSLFITMFVLNPGGNGGGVGGPGAGNGSNKSFVRQQFEFFGIQLGLYYIVLRGAYYYFSYVDSNNKKQIKS